MNAFSCDNTASVIFSLLFLRAGTLRLQQLLKSASENYAVCVLEVCLDVSKAQSCLFETPWTVACQAFLSITNSQSLLKLMSIESVMPSNHLILCRPLLLSPSIFPSIRSFPTSQLFASHGQSIGASASASVLPMNIQD